MKNTKTGLTHEQIEKLADENSFWQRRVDEFKKSTAAYKRGLTSINNVLKDIDSHLSPGQREALATAKSILISYQNDLEVIARRAGRMVIEKEHARKIEEQESNNRVFHKIFDDSADHYSVFTAIGNAIVDYRDDSGSYYRSFNTAVLLLSKIDSAEKYSDAAGLEMVTAAVACSGAARNKIETAIITAKLKSSVAATPAVTAPAIGL